MNRNAFVLLRIFLGALPGALGDLRTAAPGAGRFSTLRNLGRLLGPASAQSADLSGRELFNTGTSLMFFLIVRSLAAIGNGDRIGKFTASNIADGVVVLSITGGPRAAIAVKNHRLRFLRGTPHEYNALMEFKDMTLARSLFDGKINALACVGRGDIIMKGNLGMLDNVNRLLDRTGVYLSA